MANKGEVVFSSKRVRPAKEDQSELTSLKQENLRLEEENKILKNAAAYFARNKTSYAPQKMPLMKLLTLKHAIPTDNWINATTSNRVQFQNNF